MASPQLKAKRFPIRPDERGDARFEARNGGAPAKRFEPGRSHTRIDFGAPADRAADQRRAIGVLAAVAIAAIGAFVALIYFAGLIAAAVVATAVVAVIGFGNWVLDHTVDLF